MKVEITKGVGSNAKMWATLRDGKRWEMVGELDLPPMEITGLVWRNSGRAADTKGRRKYSSVDNWVADVAREYPNAMVVRNDSKKWSS